MKKQLCKKLCKKISKKIVKKSLALLLLFGVGTVFFQTHIVTPQAVYAQNDTNKDTGIDQKASENDLITRTQTLNAILKILYIILWPLLALAGLTLNNGMVYGSFLALDAPLWKFWNIMKNFANFALGFLVLFSIIKSIFSGENGTKAPFKIIKKALIAGVLIQASWFLLAAVIDISTVATYAIGGLPLSVLEKNNELGNKPILGTHTSFDLKEYENVETASDDFKVWYSYGSAEKISRCELKEGRYIIGLLDGDAEYSNEKNTKGKDFKYKDKDLELCTHGNILYAFNEYDTLNDANDYATQLGSLRNSEHSSFVGDADVSPRCPPKTDIASLLAMSGLPPHAVDLGNCSSKLLAKQLAQEWMVYERTTNDGMTISKMLSKLEGFTGPLVTMYASLLNFAEISNVPKEGGNAGAMWIELLIKTIFALALLVPLALICVVLLARIGIIWLVIAFMPFLILAWTFDWDIGNDNKVLSLIAKPGQLIGIIFAPVIIVFALSISVIFMTALSNSLNDDAKQHDFFESIGMDYDEEGKNISVFGTVGSELKGNETGSDFDNIKSFSSWLIMNLFGIALIRAILFAAIKATTLGKNINDKFGDADKLLGKALGAIPIMSIKGKGVGLSAIGQVAPSAPIQLLNRATEADKNQLNALFNKKSSKTGPSALDIQQYKALTKNGMKPKEASEILGFNEKEITGSAAYETYQTNASNFNKEFTNANFTNFKTNANKINPSQTATMSKASIIHAMNSGKLDFAADTGVQGANNTHYIVTQTASWMGGFTYGLEEVKDSTNITDADKAMAEKRELEILKEQKKLAEDNADTHKILQNMDKKNAQIWQKGMARLNNQNTKTTE